MDQDKQVPDEKIAAHMPVHETVATDAPSKWYQGGGEAQEPAVKENHIGHGPKNYHRSDSRIYEDVCEALAGNPDLDARGVDVSVADGRVTLRGSVEKAWAKKESETLARHCAGVRDVINELKSTQPD